MRFEWSLALGLLALAACTGDLGSSPPDGRPPPGGGGDGGDDRGPDPDPTPVSPKATVKRKTGTQIGNDLAQALELGSDELCRELGQEPCAEVHAIALRGVSAYTAGVFEPLEVSTATSPIAVDRLVLSACQTRAWRDFESGDAPALFGDLRVTEGRLDPDAPEVEAVITELYRRALLRDPKATEQMHLRDLYRHIEATGATAPARDWAALSCFAVFTTLEAVFY
ncbi:MAG: hypothetical protein AAF928_02455 [Myxococcota bacterium]